MPTPSSPEQWVTRLAGPDILVSCCFEARPGLRGGHPQALEVVVFRELEEVQPAREIEPALASHLGHPRNALSMLTCSHLWVVRLS